MDASGTITTVVGDGISGFSGDGGPATDASLFSPIDIFVDGAGDLYIADSGNERIRKVEGIAAPTTLEGVFSPSAPSEKTPDFDGDGTVSFSDFLEFAQNFGKKQEDPDFNTKYDLDDSGSVDFGDFLQFAQAFGKSV